MADPDPHRLRRSALYTPASNPRALERARSVPCDVVILDLEDAVAPERKAEARQAAVEAIRRGGFEGKEVVVRVNGLDTPWGVEDLAAVRMAPPDAVLVPKVHGPGELEPFHDLLGEVALWAMVETCSSLFALDAIASSPGLAALVMGANDLAAEMGARLGPGRAAIQAALTLTVAAARNHGIPALDGVFNDLGDREGFAREVRQARDFGFDGKTLIHPDQVAPCHAAFAPSPEELAWARAVIAAFEAPENMGLGAVRVGDRMAERLHLAAARRAAAQAGG